MRPQGLAVVVYSRRKWAGINAANMADTPKNILIIRLGAMGDIILTSGAVRDIRLAYPEATIHFLTGGNLFAKASEIGRQN